MRRPRLAALITAIGAAGLFALGAAAPAAAHGFTSVVYADVTSDEGTVVSDLKLEYDLLIVSAADAEGDDALFEEGTYAFEAQDEQLELQALKDHIDTIEAYVTERFTASADGAVCAATLGDELEMTIAEGVPYAQLTVLSDCAPTSNGHVITSTLFADEEGYVTDTKTLVTYELDLQHGSAVIDTQHPSFDTEQSGWERFWSFFVLGAEHLLFGIDHILFLLALIIGSRRLREIVLAATAFTVAHSVTFILAAVGVVSVPDAVVEPIIALSIAVVAAWYLLRLGRKRDHVDDLERRSGPVGIDPSGWLRLAIVFVFGLVHGLGFAAALGIDQPWSWTLLWSLLVFNVGIEAVQIGIILIVFPLLVLLRRKAPKVGMWVAAVIAAGVTIAGLYWFVERLIGA